MDLKNHLKCQTPHVQIFFLYTFSSVMECSKSITLFGRSDRSLLAPCSYEQTCLFSPVGSNLVIKQMGNSSRHCTCLLNALTALGNCYAARADWIFRRAVPYLIQQVAAQRASTHTMAKCIHCRVHCVHAGGFLWARGSACLAACCCKKTTLKVHLSRTGRKVYGPREHSINAASQHAA